LFIIGLINFTIYNLAAPDSGRSLVTMLTDKESTTGESQSNARRSEGTQFCLDRRNLREYWVTSPPIMTTDEITQPSQNQERLGAHLAL